MEETYQYKILVCYPAMNICRSSLEISLISSHFVESLLKLDADLSISLLPVIEIGSKQLQLLLQFGGLTFSSSGLNLSKLEVQRQISDLFLRFLVAFEGIGLGQLESLHVLTNDIQLFLELVDLLFSFFALFTGAVKLDLSHAKFSGNLLCISGGFESHFPGCFNVLLKCIHTLIIDKTLGL